MAGMVVDLDVWLGILEGEGDPSVEVRTQEEVAPLQRSLRTLERPKNSKCITNR